MKQRKNIESPTYNNIKMTKRLETFKLFTAEACSEAIHDGRESFMFLRDSYAHKELNPYDTSIATSHQTCRLNMATTIWPVNNSHS